MSWTHVLSYAFGVSLTSFLYRSFEDAMWSTMFILGFVLLVMLWENPPKWARGEKR